MHAKFLRERHNVLAALQSLHRLPAELVRIPSHSLLCHLQFPFPAQCAFSECLIFGVHSNPIFGYAPLKRSSVDSYTVLIGPGYCDTKESMVNNVIPSTVACATKILS